MYAFIHPSPAQPSTNKPRPKQRHHTTIVIVIKPGQHTLPYRTQHLPFHPPHTTKQHIHLLTHPTHPPNGPKIPISSLLNAVRSSNFKSQTALSCCIFAILHVFPDVLTPVTVYVYII